MNILVTGGNGFIGSHFIEKNINNKNVSSIHNISRKQSSTPLPHHYSKKYKEYNLDTSEESFTDNKKMLLNLELDFIVHFASYSNIDDSIKYPNLFVKSNIPSLVNLLECFKDSNVKKIINISTSEVFGNSVSKSKLNYQPKNPYAICKMTNEFFCQYYSDCYGLNVITTNCSTNFGPRQPNDKFIPMCVSNLKNKNKIKLYGTGKNIRNWLYVEDHVNKITEILFNQTDQSRHLILGENCISNYDLIHKIKNIYTKLTGDIIVDDWFEYIEDRKGHTEYDSLEMSENNLYKFEELLTKTIKSYL
jgi:dTDP-glucose 4,6-dehydratase